MRLPRPTPSRRSFVAVVVLALAALICIDCLNLTQSEEWTDLSRSPHLAAVRRVTDGDSHRLVKRADPDPIGAIVPTAVALWVVCLLWAIATELTTILSSRPRFRQRLRAPPALRFS